MLGYFYSFNDEPRNPWQMLAEPQLKITAVDSKRCSFFVMSTRNRCFSELCWRATFSIYRL